MTSMREMVGTDMRPAAMYAEIVRSTAFAAGAFARAKHIAASRLVELLEGPYTWEARVQADVLDRILAGLEDAEARGMTEAEVEALGAPMATVLGID